MRKPCVNAGARALRRGVYADASLSVKPRGSGIAEFLGSHGVCAGSPSADHDIAKPAAHLDREGSLRGVSLRSSIGELSPSIATRLRDHRRAADDVSHSPAPVSA